MNVIRRVFGTLGAINLGGDGQDSGEMSASFRPDNSGVENWKYVSGESAIMSLPPFSNDSRRLVEDDASDGP